MEKEVDIMLTKGNIERDNTVRVTFVLSLDLEANTVHLLGEFNNWQMTHSLEHQPDNTWQITLNLEPHREYQFRYLVDGENWLNDAHADHYIPNGYGEENSVVVT